MKILIKIKFFLMFLLITSSLYSQDAAFSQFYAAPVFLNPSMAGGDNTVSVNVTYRTNTNFALFPYQLGQFTVSIPVLLNSSRFSRKHSQLQNYLGSIALTAYNEFIGFENEYRVSGLNITTSYFTQISFAHFLAFGLQAGIIDKAIDFEKLTWGSQYVHDIGFDSRISPSLVLPDENNLFPVVNAGLTWFYNIKDFSPYETPSFRAFAGISFSNLNRPDDSFFNYEKIPIPILYKFHGGLAFALSEKFEILPNCLVMRQNRVNHINVGTYIAYYLSSKNDRNTTFYQIQVGSWYRVGDSYIISLGFEMKNIILGISYDLNVSNFKYNDKGVRAMEISIKYKSESKSSEGHRNISHPII